MADPLAPRIETPKEFYRRINETSPILRDEAGFYANSLERIASVLSVPKQVLFQVGKNIGEELLQQETTPDDFILDLKNAISGKSNLSFKDVMRSVNLDSLDVALPTTIENDYARWGTSLLAGIGAGMFTSPVGGFTAGFALNDALQGKGVISSGADIILDPINKIRLLPKTSKGLGVSDDIVKKLQKQGRLEDFLIQGKAYLPKAGAVKATENLYQVTLQGVLPEIENSLQAGLRKLQPLGPNRALAVVDDAGLEILKQNENRITSSALSRIQKVGEYTAGDLEEITVNKLTGSLLNNLLAGDRRLFDFKGNSGYVITQNTPFVGKFLIPTPIRSLDIGNAMGGSVVASILDKSADFLGASVAKIPGVTKLADIESKTLGKVTGAIANKLSFVPKATVISGGDKALKVRKIYENVLSDAEHPLNSTFKAKIAPLAGADTQQKLNTLEELARRTFSKKDEVVSTLDKETDIYVANAIKTIKDLAITNLKDSMVVKNIGGMDETLFKAIESGFKDKLNVTLTDLEKLDPLNPQETQKFLDIYNESVAIKENVNSWLVSDAIHKNIKELEHVKDIKEFIAKVDPNLLKGVDQLTQVHIPFDSSLNIEMTPQLLRDTLKGARNEGAEEISFYLKKNSELYNELGVKKQALEKGLQELEVKKSTNLVETVKLKEQLNKELEATKIRLANHLEEEKLLSKFLDDPSLYESALRKTEAVKEQIKQIKSDIRSANTKQDKIIEGANASIEVLKKQLEPISQDMILSEKLNKSLGNVLKLRGKDKLDISAMPKPVRDVYSRALELLGDNFQTKFKIVFDNAKVLGKVTDYDFAVAQVVKGFNPDKTHTLIMRLSQTADVLDGVNLMGRTIFSFLDDGLKQKIAQLLGEGYEKKFQELFASGVLNPQALLDNFTREQSGFFGKLHDIFRQIFSYVGELFQIPKFKNEALRTKIFEYLRGTDLNIEKKALVGDELTSVSNLIDRNTGEITDKLKMRETLNRVNKALTDAGLLSKYGGIEVGLDGVAWAPLILNNKEQYQELLARSRAIGLDVSNKGQIGESDMIAWQRMFKSNPDLVDLVVREHEIVPAGLMEEFLNTNDFTGKTNPRAVVSSVISRIASAFDIIPYEAFNNKFGLLFRTQMNVLKSLENVPISDFMKQYLTVETVENLAKNENRQIANAFNNWSFAQNAFGGADKMTLVDNEIYAHTLNEISAYLNNVPASQFSERMAKIREILRLKNVNIGKFNELKEAVLSLGEGGNAVEAGLKKKIDVFMTDFIERQGIETANAQMAIANIAKSPEVAERMTELMNLRLDTIKGAGDALVEGAEGSLSSYVKGILKIGDGREQYLKLADELDKARIANYSNTNIRKYTSLIQGDGQISKLIDFSPFEITDAYGRKVASNNPLSRSFENQLVPTSLIPVLKQEFGEPVAQLNSVTQVIRDWILGIGEQEAKKRAKDTVDFANKLLPSWGKLGERTEKSFSRFYENLNYDYILNLFKAHALLSPAFHARNMYSAIYVNTTNGVDSGSHKVGLEASYYLRSGKFKPENLTVLKDGNVEFKGIGLSSYDRDMHTLIAQAQRAGVMGGEGTSEIISKNFASRGWLDVQSLDWSPLKYNRKIAEFLEDTVRLASFKHAREILGYNLEDAGNFTKLLHFDYNLLTDFEKNTLKRVIPFYTYMRKAIARDSRMFVERTGDYYRMGALVGDAEEGNAPERSGAVNNFIKDRLGVNIKTDANGKHYYLLLGGTIPSADLGLQIGSALDIAMMRPSKAIRTITSSFLKNLSPFIKMPLESISGYDFYFNKPIKDVQGDLADIYGYEFPQEVAYYIQQVRWLRDLDKIAHVAFDIKNPLRPDLPSPGELEMGRQRQLLQTVFGIDIRQNAKPDDNLYYNEVLPRKQEQASLLAEIRRQQKIGNTSNLKNAVEQYKLFIQRQNKLYLERNSAQQDIFRQIRD